MAVRKTSQSAPTAGEDRVAQAQRAVACRGWRWMFGMVDRTGRRVSWRAHEGIGGCGGIQTDTRVRPDNGPLRHDALPDFDDPLTAASVLILARAAWGCDAYRRLTIEPAGAGYCLVLRNARHKPPSRAQPGWDLDPVSHPRYRDVLSPWAPEYPSELEAALAALETAPSTPKNAS